MMTWLQTIIYGIIQGITEWLPISSTGHLLLADELMQMQVFDNPVLNQEFLNMFFVVIQFGSILAVCLLYFHKLNPFSPKKNETEKKDTLALWGKVIVGCIPAGIAGVLLDDVIDAYLHGPVVIAIMLIVYGVFFLVIENQKRNAKVTSFAVMSFKTALLIGCCQMLALIPGTSRSGATILGAVLIGCSREIAAEFSFFLAVPVMAGASLLKVLKMFKAGVVMNALGWGVLGLGTLVSFVVSVLAIRFLMSYIRKNDFKIFGVYRIVLGLIILAVMLF